MAEDHERAAVITIILTDDQYKRAEVGGLRRIRFDTNAGYRAEEETAKGGRNYDRRESDHILGALGEVAYAVWQNKDWRWDFPPIARRGEIKAADFDNDRDIKTIYTGGTCLLLQKRDHDERIFILAIGEIKSREVHFMGWAYGHEGKKQENWTDRARSGRPCYWMQRKDMHPMETCPGIKNLPTLKPELKRPKLPTKLAPGALCGSMACGGCYSIGDGKMIHPPWPGYNQQDLMEMD